MSDWPAWSEMDGGEVVIGVVSAIIVVVAWLFGWLPFLLTTWRPDRGAPRWRLFLATLIMVGGTLVILNTLADAFVRSSDFWIGYYLMMTLAWVGLVRAFWKYLGLFWRDDALERCNPAAATAVVGAMIGSTAAFSGAHIGDGPGWWCVVIAGGIATILWLLAWLVLELATKLRDSVAVERCPAAGWRQAGFLIASGLIAGRGAAGDWTSFEQTAIDFHVSWPLLALVAIAIVFELSLKPTPEHPRRATITALPILACYAAIVFVALQLAGPLWPQVTSPEPMLEQP